MAGSKRRSARQAAGRQRSMYTEPDSDEDFDDQHSGPEPEPAPEPMPAEARPRKRQRTEPKRPRLRSQRKQPAVNSTKASKAPKSKAHAQDKPTGFTGPSDNVIPAWTSLPVSILREVFEYAIASSANQPAIPRRASPTFILPFTFAGSIIALSIADLSTTARVCSAFASSALEAFYYSPILAKNAHPHLLLELLRDDQHAKYLQYGRKIKRLVFDVGTLAYGRPVFDIASLFKEVPQLRDLEIIHPRDTPPFRPLAMHKWHYPPHTFEKLAESGIRLKSWRWTRDMVATTDESALYELMAETHTSKSFEGLERLVVCAFNCNNHSVESEHAEGEEVPAPGLATSIALLPNLKDLTFISCDVIMDRFLERLPRTLERLELVNCLELTSDMLSDYLAIAGAHLRELVLNHNPALNLKFITNLRHLCPRLELLSLDFHCYSERMNSSDAEPLYTELLGDDDMPSWPSTLHQLELIHVQRCSAPAAQNLFRSLVDCAKDLPDLRHLVIQAHIGMAWRDRAGFRDQWIERLQRVYSRKSESPNPHLGSLKQFRLFKESQNEKHVVTHRTRVTSSIDTPIKRRKAAYIDVTPAKHDGDTEFHSSSPEPRPQRRSQRVIETRASTSESPPGNDDSDDATDKEEEPEYFIQGLCDVVDVRIDNQRPREMQFSESHFLDSEVSGDEDWDEDADVDEEEYAW